MENEQYGIDPEKVQKADGTDPGGMDPSAAESDANDQRDNKDGSSDAEDGLNRL